MTIAAFRRLLDEIDTQGGPEAARHNRLHLPDPQEGPTMAQPITEPPAVNIQLKAVPTPEPAPIPVGQLLKWGDEHPDPDIRDQATRARVALTGLRRRHAADQELAAIADEREQLERRLAEIQAREAELAPSKPKKTRKPLDYPAAEVRAWAKANGHACPDRGRVPKTVLDAWRAAQATTA